MKRFLVFILVLLLLPAAGCCATWSELVSGISETNPTITVDGTTAVLSGDTLTVTGGTITDSYLYFSIQNVSPSKLVLDNVTITGQISLSNYMSYETVTFGEGTVMNDYVCMFGRYNGSMTVINNGTINRQAVVQMEGNGGTLHFINNGIINRATSSTNNVALLLNCYDNGGNVTITNNGILEEFGIVNSESVLFRVFPFWDTITDLDNFTDDGRYVAQAVETMKKVTLSGITNNVIVNLDRRYDKNGAPGRWIMYRIPFYTLVNMKEEDIRPYYKGTVATGLSYNGSDITIPVGGVFNVKKSQFSLSPAGSLINGRGTYDESHFSLYGWNNIFKGRSVMVDKDGNEVEENPYGDKEYYFRVNTPGYYIMEGATYYYDSLDEEYYEINADRFLLTVLDENGNLPEHNFRLNCYDFSTATVGETVQINWEHVGSVDPDQETIITIYKDGTVVKQMDYLATDDDKFYVDSAGTYRVHIRSKDALGAYAEDEFTFVATEASPLVLNSLTLEPYNDGVRWILDYEGGHGTKTTTIELKNVDTGEVVDTKEDGFYPIWTSYEVTNGARYQVTMIVTDEQESKTITSNVLTLSSENVFTLPSSLTLIESEAFKNVPATLVQIPAGATYAEDAFDDGVIIQRK